MEEFPDCGESLWGVFSSEETVNLISSAAAAPFAEPALQSISEFSHLKQRLDQNIARVKASIASLEEEHTRELAELLDFGQQSLQRLSQTLESRLDERNRTVVERVPSLEPVPGRPNDRDDDLDAKKVIDFWKAKHTELNDFASNQKQELMDMTTKLNDIRYLQTSSDQDIFKTHRLIGLLREKEATERLRADWYHEALEQLVVPATPRTGSPKTKIPESNRQGAPAMSPIEQHLATQEQQGVERALVCWLNYRSCLVEAQKLRSDRQECLRERIAATKAALTVKAHSLDRTLAEVLELRNSVGLTNNALPLQKESLEEVSRDLEIAREELRQSQRTDGQVERELLNELRERKVDSIRALYRSSGDLDSQFMRLKAEQQVNVLSSSLRLAEENRAKLLAAIANAEESVRINAGFLDRCT
jgi:hypothetical protein